MPWRRERLPTSILAWRIPWTVQSMGSQRVRYDWATFTSLHFRPLCLWMCSSAYQLPSSGFSTSVNFCFFKCHRHLLCSDFDIQENIFIFMPYWNLQCITDKAVKCDNKNLFNHKKKETCPMGNIYLAFLIYLVCFWFCVLPWIVFTSHGSECL